jgi:hypothetical protein
MILNANKKNSSLLNNLFRRKLENIRTDNIDYCLAGFLYLEGLDLGFGFLYSEIANG